MFRSWKMTAIATVWMIVVFALSVALINKARAQGRCHPRDFFAANLEKKYDEVLSVRAVVNQGQMLLEVYVSRDFSTFTILKVNPNKIACLLDAGKGWMTIEPKPVGDDS